MTRHRIQDAIAKFPPTFGLRGFPGDTFRMSPDASFINDNDQVTLYTQRLEHLGIGTDVWQDFAKGSIAEMHAQVIRPDTRWAGSESLNAEIKQELAAEERGDKPLVTLLDKRNIILQSLRDQFATKVRGINVVTWPTNLTLKEGPALDAFLLDLANNAAEALGES